LGEPKPESGVYIAGNANQGTTMSKRDKSGYSGRAQHPVDRLGKSDTNTGAEKRADLIGSKPGPPVQPSQPISERFPALEEQEVELSFSAPTARSVQVAGTFNDWRPESGPLEPAEEGEWKARLRLKSGQYEYRFVVDGVWADDPRSTASSANPFGGRNSILKVGLDDRTDLL
jgi:hypothetical protein